MILTKEEKKQCSACKGSGRHQTYVTALCLACLGTGIFVERREVHVPVTPEEAKRCNKEFWNE